MNILILSSGTRNKIIEYFKRELNGKGKVICTDCSPLAPTLYIADKHYIVPRIDDSDYLNVILEICKKENIKGLFSLIDPELSLIARNKEQFINNGVMPFVSDYEIVETCFDKYKMFKKCQEFHIPTIKSYIDYSEFKKDYKSGLIDFPVFVKPYNGSCSMNIQKTLNGTELTVVVEGRLDTTTSPRLEEELRSNVEGITSLVMDFEKLEYISSAGLRVLLAMQKIMNQQGQMVLKNVSEAVMEVLEVTGFVDILTIE